MTAVAFVMPIRLVSEPNARGHWGKRHGRASEQRGLARALAHSRGVHRMRPPCVVTITRIGKRRLDDDNAVASCKAVRDGVADALGIDDSDPRVEWRYEQETKQAYAVRVRVEGA